MLKLWRLATTEDYNVALATGIFPFSGPQSEKVGHFWSII